MVVAEFDPERWYSLTLWTGKRWDDSPALASTEEVEYILSQPPEVEDEEGEEEVVEAAERPINGASKCFEWRWNQSFWHWWWEKHLDVYANFTNFWWAENQKNLKIWMKLDISIRITWSLRVKKMVYRSPKLP